MPAAKERSTKRTSTFSLGSRIKRQMIAVARRRRPSPSMGFDRGRREVSGHFHPSNFWQGTPLRPISLTAKSPRSLGHNNRRARNVLIAVYQISLRQSRFPVTCAIVAFIQAYALALFPAHFLHKPRVTRHDSPSHQPFPAP